MNYLKVTDMEIIDDCINDQEIIKRIAETQTEEDSFFLFNIGNLIKQHKIWLEKIPRVTPHFGT